VLEAIPTIRVEEQPQTCVEVAVEKPHASWYKRYYYLPPRQRAGRILVVARQAKRFKHEKLAEITGISKDRLVEMEQGFRAISEQEARQLANALAIDYQPLLEEYQSA
jgi:ribosome-binding protein aMBF1 (putative translation factor)